MQLSSNLSKITGSATAIILSKAKGLEAQGKEIIHFEIGQPDFPPPQGVLDATVAAIKAKKTAYTVSNGLRTLRERIAGYHSQLDDISLDFNSEVIVTAGAKLSVFSSLWSVVNEGDNVIVFNPSWVSYGDMVQSLGAEARFLPVDMNFGFSEERLLDLIDTRTKACIVNSPSNPTGAIIGKQALTNLYRICKDNEILLISDEIYREYVYDGEFTSLAHIPDWQEYGAVIQGFSKTFSMTGFRIGYTLSNAEIIAQVNKIQQLTSTCPVNFAQHGALHALDCIDEMRQLIQQVMLKRRNLVTNLLSELPVTFLPPQGAFYAWVKLPGITDSTKWAAELLTTHGVAVIPGIAFGSAGEGFIRISFATSEDNLTTGIHKIGQFLA